VLITLEQLEDDPVTFDEKFPPGQVDDAVLGLKQVADLQVTGVASAIEREIHVVGNLSTEVQMECGRCLEPLVMAVKRKFDLFYVPMEERPEEDEQAVPRGEEELGFYDGEALVLEDVAKEQVLLSLPMRGVCREDCKGLCPHCGINRNRETCSCEEKIVDPRWEALKKF
jgi:uncharacterized protein